MRLQYYETMDDKSKEYLSYLIEHISPKFTENELKLFLEDLNSQKAKKSKSKGNFVQIGDDNEKIADLSKLNLKELKLLFQVFISREKNDRIAVKWRFYQYLKYMLNLNKKSIKINQETENDLLIDFLIETIDKEMIYVLCYEVLEVDNFNKAIEVLNDFAKKQNSIPNRVIFVASKSFRNIPIDIPIKFANNEIETELWVEWTEENPLFSKEDLLIVNDSELKVAGFNFSSTEDLLNYVFKHSKGGQISIYKQIDFFTVVDEQVPEAELFWKGLMIK